MTIRQKALYGLGALGAGYLLALTSWPLHLPTVCIFKRITGLPCGACGMTHACCALAHGDISQAISYHFAVIPLALVVLTAAVLLAAEALSNRPFLQPVWKKTGTLLVWGGVAIFTLGWVVNLAKVFHPEFTL
jgi:hypothetical protein